MKSATEPNPEKRRGVIPRWKAALRSMKIRVDLPPGLEKEFIEFKDIHSIDRIRIGAWIAVAFSILLFPLDYNRYVGGEMEDNIHFLYLFYFHIFGLLFIIPALSMTFHKPWVIATRLRRGIHIWSMVVMSFIYLFGMAIIVFKDRDGLILFMAFIFIFGWMFTMTHKERLIFNLVTLPTMFFVIATEPTVSEGYGKISMYYEIVFLSLVAFYFDAFDYNLTVSNFLARKSIIKDREKIQHLEEFKSRFFTNLTHEIRTPLTLISGMAREIKEHPSKWAKEGSEIIERNAANLLQLINQILELSKIESGSLKVNWVRGNMVSYVGYIADAFRGLTIIKNIQLHFLPVEEEIMMDFDPDKYAAILSNLLSNAIRFTPQEGNIYIQVSRQMVDKEPHLELSIRDTGTGISEESLAHIFERFYQGDNNHKEKGFSSGIGLSLVNELVKLLNGQIKVKSQVGIGTHFTLTFPITEAAEKITTEWQQVSILHHTPDLEPTNGHALSEVEEGDEDLKTEVLIIEDNQDVMKYIQVCLGDIYQLYFAQNGEEGIRKAMEIVPDLILSDVMMPGKDGLAVCRELKAHPGTSHIPVVLLSAKADVESRIAGLEQGADVYMLKPFEKRELQAQLATLLDKRREMQAYYSGIPSGHIIPKDTPVKASEDAFVSKVRNVIMDHLDDSEFSVVHLCRAVLLSRTQLHKKLKALTGFSASHFIRRIRLYAGMDMLKTTDFNVAEIAYRVGFDDPNYFSRCFAQEFGASPSETRK